LRAFEILPGGQAATVAVGCARQGWRVRYMGSLGDDEWGRTIERGLKNEGVDLAVVRRARCRSRIAIVLVDAGGRRTVLEYRDPALARTPAEIDRPTVTSGRVLMVDGSDLDASIAAARAARLAGIPTVVDVDRPGPGVDTLLAEIDVIVVPGRFVMDYTGLPSVGGGLARLERQYPRSLIVATLGAEGALARSGGVEFRQAARAVDVVDTTGAGDAFRAGLISGWLRAGRTAQVDTVLEYATATAGLACRALGAQSALPRRAEVDAVVTGTGRA
jgi:sugar/nucleoside kinase (ribokinase family)